MYTNETLEIPGARLTIWEKNNLGIIGHYEAVDGEAGISLIKEAWARLGTKKIIGPMNGNTWQPYRLVIGCPSNDPFFPGEPSNPLEYHDHFLQAGFKVAQRYVSRIVHLNKPIFCRPKPLNIFLENVTKESFERHVKEIYYLSLTAFRDNHYYEPITFQEFYALYKSVKPLLDFDFVVVAYDETRRLVGFAFAYPSAPGSDCLVYKTLAVAKEMRLKGLGRFLFEYLHDLAQKKGYRTVIHALMHTNNRSLTFSKSLGSVPFRKYALYCANIRSGLQV